MRTLIAACAALVLVGSLTACSVAEADAPVDDPVAEGSTEQEHCLVGTWTLDTEDYRGQAEAYLKSLSIPIEGLAVSGTQTLTFEAEGVEQNVGLSTDLQWSGSLLGNPFVVDDESAGVGAWEPSSMDADQVVVDTWMWGLEPHVAPGDAPSIPSLGLSDNGPIDVTCTETTLELHGTDAILTGRFTRVS